MTEGTSWILAICVAILAVIGIFQPSKENPSEHKMFPFILIPYAALGLSILVFRLLAFLSKCRKKSSDQFIKWSADDDPDSVKHKKKWS